MGDLDLDLHPGFAWGALLLAWVGLMVLGGAVHALWLSIRDSRWLRRLHKLERGRKEQADA
jgi:hypothetical protein